MSITASSTASSFWVAQGTAASPGTSQNELAVDDAVMLIANNVRYYVEGANMPATTDALKLLRLSPKILTAGAKAFEDLIHYVFSGVNCRLILSGDTAQLPCSGAIPMC